VLSHFFTSLIISFSTKAKIKAAKNNFLECDKLEYVVRVKMFIYISTRSLIVFCSFFHRHNINSRNILSSNFQAITLQYTSLTSFLDEVASHLKGVILHVRQFDVEVVEGTLVHLVNFVGR